MAKAVNKKSNLSETALIRELAKILNETDLSEIEMEKGDLRLRVARMGAQLPVTTHAVQAPIQAPTVSSTSSTVPQTEPADNKNAVKSPMVGTAYLRASPDSDPFFNIGDSVKMGDTVLLIEAMKTFNPIKAEKSGTISAIFVEDGQAIEFGEALLVIS